MLPSILLLLLSLSVSGSLVIILTWAICRLLKKKLSHRWQYYIWMAAIVRLLFPFALEENLIAVFKHSEWAGSIAYMTGKKLKFTKKQVRTARKHTPNKPLTSKDLD